MEPFGNLLGIAPGNVPAYSSDYTSASPTQYPKRSSFRSYVDGIYMGYKWQCVEFARRWLYINKGYIFNDVAMAYDIFDLRSVRDLKNNSLLPLNAFLNGSTRHPEPGCMLIWEAGGEFENTGHVAIVTEVTDSMVRIVEQNVNHLKWPNNRNYSRELKSTVTPDGEYWVSCSFNGAQILGWMLQTNDQTAAVPVEQTDSRLFNIKSFEATPVSGSKKFLNLANADEAIFVQAMQGHKLNSLAEDDHRYLAISNAAQEQVQQASNELHELFMHATEYVLATPELLQHFNLPEQIIPKIKQSWDNRLNELITSRFDFALTPKGLKAYEYNCDSASCYMESGKVQGMWLEHHKIDRGVDAGKKLFKKLIKAWTKCKADDLVHVLRDDDIEEQYHALFMQDAIQAAGLRCKLLTGFDQLSKSASGDILDADGEPVRWVWKTWAWETALEQIREPHKVDAQKVNLADILLNDSVMVYEPLWTLIPSNKAILPVLWSMFPNHPYLLHSSFELDAELTNTGYVVKPIVGRCGANISLVTQDAAVISETQGQFEDQTMIYQEFFPLPKVAERYTQISAFMVSGIYAGAGARIDPSPIINKNSDCLPLIVEPDSAF